MLHFCLPPALTFIHVLREVSVTCLHMMYRENPYLTQMAGSLSECVYEWNLCRRVVYLKDFVFEKMIIKVEQCSLDFKISNGWWGGWKWDVICDDNTKVGGLKGRKLVGLIEISNIYHVPRYNDDYPHERGKVTLAFNQRIDRISLGLP